MDISLKPAKESVFDCAHANENPGRFSVTNQAAGIASKPGRLNDFRAKS
jgi:hypothetical protein